MNYFVYRFDIKDEIYYNNYNYADSEGEDETMKKFFSVIIAIILTLSVLPLTFSASAADYTAGTYLVEASAGVRLYKTNQESYEFVTIAPEGTYLTVIKIEDGFGYTVFDSVYGWIDLSDDVEYISEKPSVTDKNKIEGAKAIHITKAADKTTYTAGEEVADITYENAMRIFDLKQVQKK